MSGSPYVASEDSALLRQALEGRGGGAFLEIGAGNAGNLVAQAGRFLTVAGTDLVKPTMTDWRSRGNFVLADRASCFRDNTFDLVAFNPPYLKGRESGDLAVDGGEGLETPKAFLEDALRVVKKPGEAVFLLNWQAEVGDFESICRQKGFAMRRLLSKRVFFEALEVFEAAYGL